MLAAIGLGPAEAGLRAIEWTPTVGALLHDAIFPTAAFLLLVMLALLSFLRRGRDASPAASRSWRWR